MRTADEHTKLARAALDFYPNLDSAFEINVAKVRVSLPQDLRDQLKEPVERLVKRAKGVYDRKADIDPSPRRKSAGSTRREAPGNDAPVDADGAKRVRVALEHAARKVEEEEALKRIVRALRTESPEVASELGW